MAASFSAPACKLIFEKSNLKHEKARYKNIIQTKIFNFSVSLIIPGLKKPPQELASTLEDEPYWIAHKLPLCKLVDKEFIEGFVKKGQVYMLSQGTHIDTDNCFALLPTGQLILNIDKDTYEELGLEGEQSTFNKKRVRKYVVKIDLTAAHFTPGKKNYDRVRWCLTERLNLVTDFLFYWKPNDDQVCPSSLSCYFDKCGWQCELCSVTTKTRQSGSLQRPVVDSCTVQETDENCSYMEFWEWLGAQALRIQGGSIEYVSSFTCPSPSVDMQSCVVCSYSGFIVPQQVLNLVQKSRDYLKVDRDCPWVAATVHGFTDSPVSWASWEHGHHVSGDNLYTFIIFPNDDYWCYMASGSADTFC